MKHQLLAAIICQLLAVSIEYLLFPVVSRLVWLFPAASEIGRFQSYLSTAVSGEPSHMLHVSKSQKRYTKQILVTNKT